MSLDRSLLRAYLRQRAELGEHEVFLDDMTAAEALRLLRPATGDPADADRPSSVVDHPTGADEDRQAQDGGGGKGRQSAAEAEGQGKKELVGLGERASVCTRCRLHEGRNTVVFGVGNPAADVVVVGEAPGAEEDRTGLPFVGQAGKLLDLMLMSVGLRRADVYICNVLKCRPPNNRNPMADEVEACSEYLHGQLELIAPRVLLAVGKFAAQTLTGRDTSIGRLRGAVHSYRGIPLIASYHPAYLLRSPNMTAAAWQDLQLLRQVLDGQL